jgi:hypothetical protein
VLVGGAVPLELFDVLVGQGCAHDADPRRDVARFPPGVYETDTPA